MFILEQTSTFSVPVKFSLPGLGGRLDGEFTATFNRPNREDLDAIGRAEDGSERTDAEVCRLRLAGWSGVTDGAGAAIAFTPDTRDQLLAIPGMDRVIALAFFTEVQALPRKN